MEDGIENTILKVNCIHMWKISDRTLIKHAGNISTDWESGREWTYSSPLPTCQFFSLHFGKNTLTATTPSPLKSVIKVNHPLAMGGPSPKPGHRDSRSRQTAGAEPMLWCCCPWSLTRLWVPPAVTPACWFREHLHSLLRHVVSFAYTLQSSFLLLASNFNR